MPLSRFLTQPQNIGQPLTQDKAVEIILQVASALDSAHQNGILHQAIQPQSIYVAADLNTAKLTDFGHNLLIDISRVAEKEDIISTFGYLSPESSGILRKPVDGRSDIYSLGILLYQLTTGRLPYTAGDVSTLIHQHIAKMPDPPSALNEKLSPAINNIILHLISKDPQDRYQSLGGLITDLKEYQKQRARGKDTIDFEIARSDKLAQLSFSTRIIGRDKELKQLKDFLEQTQQGRGNLCFISGEPGIGKSRLVDELRGNIHGLGGIFCGGKCYQYEFRTPYKVFAEAIDAYIEKVKRLSQQEQQVLVKRIKEALGELGGEVVKIAPAITQLIGQPPKLVELDPEREKVRFLITVTNFLASLSSPETPLLMFLDDLQWADDGSLEILERTAGKLQNTAALLIVSYRDTEVDQTHPLAQLINKFKEQKTSLSEIPVRAFNLEETGRMIGQILMEKEEEMVPLAKKLYERAKGNPFFTLELLHSLVDANVIFLREDHYLYDLKKLESSSLPSTIVDAVLKRVEDLFESSLQVLSYASVMGKEIDFKMLTDLAKRPFEQIVNSVEDGIRNQLLYRDLTGRESVFFMHDRIREAFYRRVPEEERPSLHRSIAQILEEENKGDLDTVLYDLAYHFSQGQLEDKALQYCVPAAHKAKSSYANTLAINLYNTAKGILEKQNKANTAAYLDVLENLGEVYRYAARFDGSLETLKACEQLIPEQDKIHKAQVLSKIGATLFEKGETENSTKVLRQALRILDMRLADTKAGVFLNIMKEFSRQMLHAWFPKVFVSETLHANPVKLLQAQLLSRLCMGTYFLDKIATVYIWLKSLNFSEKIGPSAELADFYVLGCGAWTTIPWFYRAFRDGYKGMKMAQQVGDKIKEGCGYSYLAWAA
ncbi:MAG: AAA family ATPase, partial [Candidatus Omnitrophota bacterium]